MTLKRSPVRAHIVRRMVGTAGMRKIAATSRSRGSAMPASLSCRVRRKDLSNQEIPDDKRRAFRRILTG